MNENQLILNAQSGDQRALSELIKNYEQTIYNFSFKICRDREKAENIMQETFLSMVKSLHQFDGKSKLSTWLYRIVANHCLMQVRKEKRRNFISLEDEDGLYDDKYLIDWKFLPSKYTDNSELRKILDESISKLSPEYRAVFLLRDVEGLSTEETAKAVDLSVPAVKSRLHRARAYLRNELTEAYKK
jgi:RNA polymerase sigma-70 factor, ECF subfamily